MKHFFIFFTVLFSVLFSTSTLAVECLASWEKSISANVKHYTIYKNDEVLADDIIGLSFKIDCETGEYSVSTTNQLGFKSEKSNPFVIEKPESPTGFKVSPIIINVNVNIGVK